MTNANKTPRDALVTAFDKAGFTANPEDMSLFDYNFERALGFSLGKAFSALIPNAIAIAEKLTHLGAIGYENRIARNGTDAYSWVEQIKLKRSDRYDSIICIGNQTQNNMYLVYILEKYGSKEIHIRRIWRDYHATVRSGNYMLGKPVWDKINNPTYADVIEHANTACDEYSDDMYDKDGNSLNPDKYMIKRPCLKTHLQGLGNEGMKCLDGRDKGYIVSVKEDILSEQPYCDSPITAMQTKLEYIYRDFRCFLEYPYIDGEE